MVVVIGLGSQTSKPLFSKKCIDIIRSQVSLCIALRAFIVHKVRRAFSCEASQLLSPCVSLGVVVNKMEDADTVNHRIEVSASVSL